MARLLAWKLSIHGVSPTGTTTVTSTGGALNRYPAGTQVTLQHISGHRDGDATSCPGDGLYAQLPRLREMTSQVILPPAPKLSLGADSTRVTFGTKAGLRAALAGPDGAPLAGRPLGLQVLGRTGWNTLQSLSTDAAGSLSTRLRLAYTHAVRARFAGEPGLGSAQSSPVLVGVRPLVQAKLEPSAASLARGQRITVAGAVRPHKSSILLVVERATATGRSVRVARRALRARGGQVRARFRFERSGSYSVRLAVKPDRRNLSGRSPRLSVKVR